MTSVSAVLSHVWSARRPMTNASRSPFRTASVGGRKGLFAAAVNDSLGEHVASGGSLADNRPLDAVAAAGLCVSEVALQPHAAVHRAAPADPYVAVRAGVHGHAATGKGDALHGDGPLRSIADKPRCLWTASLSTPEKIDHRAEATPLRSANAPAVKVVVAQQRFAFTVNNNGRTSAAAGGTTEVPAARTKKPYSGARIGPCSKSRVRKVKLPDLVQTVIRVSSGWP